MQNPIIDDLIEILKSYPGITKKTATKIAFDMIKRDAIELDNLITAIRNLNNYVFSCNKCHFITNDILCYICKDINRMNDVIMIVESAQDVEKFEQGEFFQGRYLVWDATVKNSKTELLIMPDDLKYIRTFKKVVLALSPNLQGEIKANYLSKQLIDQDVTKLAIGLPFGSQIDYIDSVTLKEAFANRKKI